MEERRSVAREYLEALIIAAVFLSFTNTFVIQSFYIPSGSMEDTLLVGDHLIVDKFGSRPIDRGQVVVFKSPEQPETDLIKRVIGLPGETVELRGRTVYINGQPLTEPYTRFMLSGSVLDDATLGGGGGDVRRSYGPVTVPADHYFMMGDSRDNSRDSRYWGFMPGSHLRGRALFVYFSLGESLGAVRWGRILHQIR